MAQDIAWHYAAPPRFHSLEQRKIVSGVIAGDNSAMEAFVREYEPRIVECLVTFATVIVDL
jgi:hypothetical protein